MQLWMLEYEMDRINVGSLCLQYFDAVGWEDGYLAYKKLSGRVLACLFILGEVQMCIWPSWCHCHSLSVASGKSRLILIPAHPCNPRQSPEGHKTCVCVCVCVCVRVCVCACVRASMRAHVRACSLTLLAEWKEGHLWHFCFIANPGVVLWRYYLLGKKKKTKSHSKTVVRWCICKKCNCLLLEPDVLSGHTSNLRCCLWLPEMRRVVSASDDKTVR